MSETDKTIEIFRPGTFTSVEGKRVSFSPADLQAVADNYDATLHEAPLVIGHPHLDAPAYGWARSLKVEGGRLVADSHQVVPAFAEAVKAGRYKKISPSFYPADHPANPRPGALYLKHIGFLGAAAPAVKGLSPVHFSEEEDANCITFETPNPLPHSVKEPVMASAQKNDDELSFAEREAALEQREISFAGRGAELEAAEAELAARRKADAESAAKALHEANVSFAEAQATAGKLAPAGKGKVIAILDALGGDAALSFGEGDAAVPLADAFKSLFDTAAPIISFGELVKDKPVESVTISFAAPQGYEVDPERAVLHERAIELQAADPKLSYAEAVQRAARG